MKYKVKVEPQALADIQEITDWYNDKQAGLGKRFQTSAIKQIDGLCKNPHVCAIRYKEILSFGFCSCEKSLKIFLRTIRHKNIFLFLNSKKLSALFISYNSLFLLLLITIVSKSIFKL